MTDYWKFGKCPLNRGGKRKFWEVTFGSGWPKWTLPVEYKLCFNEERHKILTITFIKVTDITETLRTMLNETGRNDRLLIIEIDPLQVYCRNFTWVLTKFVLRSKLTAKLDSFLGGGGGGECHMRNQSSLLNQHIGSAYHTHLSTKMYHIDQLLLKKNEAFFSFK